MSFYGNLKMPAAESHRTSPSLRRLPLLLGYAVMPGKSVPGRSRACGLLIRNQPLCLLSYGGVEPQKWYRALDLNQDLLSSELSASAGLG